jgi:hypothetical protein
MNHFHLWPKSCPSSNQSSLINIFPNCYIWVVTSKFVICIESEFIYITYICHHLSDVQVEYHMRFVWVFSFLNILHDDDDEDMNPQYFTLWWYELSRHYNMPNVFGIYNHWSWMIIMDQMGAITKYKQSKQSHRQSTKENRQNYIV